MSAAAVTTRPGAEADTRPRAPRGDGGRGSSHGRVCFYAIAPDEVSAALAALGLGGFHPDYGPAPAPDDPPQIELGEPMVRTTALLADGVETGEVLAEAAPTATFHIWTEPAEGGLGQCLIHIAGFGIWTAECDACGDPFYDAAEIRKALDTAGGKDLRHVVRDLTGERWTDALSAARRFLDALPHGERRVVAWPTTPTRTPAADQVGAVPGPARASEPARP